MPVALLLACSGTIDSAATTALPPQSSAALPAPGAAPASTPTTPGTPPSLADSQAMGESSLSLLTRTRYENTVASLFGVEATAVLELPRDAQLNGLTALAAREIAVAATVTELHERNAYALVEWAFADENRRTTVLGCAEAAPCLQVLLDDLGPRAFRRPLSAEESSRYRDLAALAAETLTEEVWAGPKYVLAALLQSPGFLYRSQLGSPDPEAPNRRKLDDYELASRLSFLLTDAPPDAQLADSLRRRTLIQDFPAHMERLLSMPQNEAALARFFAEYLGISELGGLNKDRDLFPDFDAELAAQMLEETQRFVVSVVSDEQRPFGDIFTAQDTFLSARLGSLYGVEVPADDQWHAVSFSAANPRPGVLGQASVLTTQAHSGETSPTRRGKFVREALLCQSIPEPPVGVSTELESAAPGGKTKRAVLSAHAEEPTCAACHALTDPIGLALEHFDAIGRYRQLDQGEAIDPSGALDGVPFNDALGLGEAVADHKNMAGCLVRVLLRHTTGSLEVDAEELLVQSLTQDFNDGGQVFRQLLKGLVLHPAFSYVRQTSTEIAQ